MFVYNNNFRCFKRLIFKILNAYILEFLLCVSVKLCSSLLIISQILFSEKSTYS